MAVAEASLRISIDAMSFGLRDERGFPMPTMPSTTKRGSLLVLMELVPPDPDHRLSTGLSGSLLNHLNTRHFPLQGLSDIDGPVSDHLLTADVRNRTCKASLFLLPVTDHHHLIDGDCGGLQQDSHRLLATDRYLPRLIPDIGDDKGIIRSRIVESERSVHIGRGTCCRSLDPDIHPRQTLIGYSICDDSGQSSPLIGLCDCFRLNQQ